MSSRRSVPQANADALDEVPEANVRYMRQTA